MAVYSKERRYQLLSREVSCPICLSTQAHLLYSINSEQVSEHIFRENKNREFFSKLKVLTERLWQGGKCDFVRCDTCRFCFAIPFIPGDKEFYALAYENENSYSSWKWEYQETYTALQDLARQRKLTNSNLLEIGAGNGSFVKKVAPVLFLKENILCTEYSEVGKRTIKQYGISCISQDIRDLDLSKIKTRFDFVCMFQVLEHMDNLDTLFNCLNRITKKSATFFIAVPNDKRREFFDQKGIFEDVPPIHVGRFNQTCFDILAKRYGWKLVNLKIEPQSFISKVTEYSLHSLNRLAFVNHLDQISSRLLRRGIKALIVAICLVGSLPTIIQLKSSELGKNQWVRLERF